MTNLLPWLEWDDQSEQMKQAAFTTLLTVVTQGQRFSINRKITTHLNEFSHKALSATSAATF